MKKLKKTLKFVMSSPEELPAVFSYLRSLNFHFSDTWVTECVNYYKSINTYISLETLKREVKQQWLLLNLREIKVPSLPPGASNIDKTVLYGKYAVQVESIVDCSESYYSQFQKIRKVCDENIKATKESKDWKIESNRCLIFTISDGVQELQAMEYEPLKKIRTNDPELLPGFKMIILGPVECRKGMILLKEENVKICGGEVDTLTISNSLESVLIKKLELNESDCSKEFEKFHEPDICDNVEELCVTNLLSQNDEVLLSLPLESDILTKTSIKNEQKTLEVMEKEKKETNIDNSFLNTDNFLDFSEIDVCVTSQKKHGLPLENSDTPSKKRISLDPDTLTPLSSVDHESHVFIDESQTQILIETPYQKKPKQTTLPTFFHLKGSAKKKDLIVGKTQPFIYLKQIVQLTLKKACTFTIKSIFLTLNKKITVVNDEYQLSAVITDGSLCIDVDLCSPIIESLLGFSPLELTVMINSSNGNSAVGERIKETFAKAQQQLISTNCLMKIRCFPGEKKPLIVSFNELNAYHLNALKQRQNYET